MSTIKSSSSYFQEALAAMFVWNNVLVWQEKRWWIDRQRQKFPASILFNYHIISKSEYIISKTVWAKYNLRKNGDEPKNFPKYLNRLIIFYHIEHDDLTKTIWERKAAV